jgi:hypothetical protein
MNHPTEVEIFAAFVIAHRNIQTPLVLNDDISSQELMQFVENSGSFDWLDAEEEDVYSLEDGKAFCFGTLTNENRYSHTGI